MVCDSAFCGPVLLVLCVCLFALGNFVVQKALNATVSNIADRVVAEEANSVRVEWMYVVHPLRDRPDNLLEGAAYLRHLILASIGVYYHTVVCRILQRQLCVEYSLIRGRRVQVAVCYCVAIISCGQSAPIWCK